MATRTITRTNLDPRLTFFEHLTLKGQAARIATRSNTLKDRLKNWMPKAPDAYRNENGSVFVDLDETVEVDGTSYKGMELRRSVSVKFNEETAERVLKTKEKNDPGIVRDAQSSYIDQDKVHRLLAEGRISEEELDQMFEEDESFAFWPVKGEVV